MIIEHNNLFKFAALYNVRHLGGIKGLDGKKTKDYKYIRGSAKGALTTEEKEHLYVRGVRVIVDLRYESERIKAPSPVKDYKDMRYYNVDMMGEFWQMREQGYHDLTDLYRDLLDDAQDKIRDVLLIFLKHREEGIYFHCTAGKDRTGIISMLLLDLGGVDRATIIANYAESYEHNKERPGYKFMKEEWRKYTYSNPEYMETALAYLDEKYGGSENYLKLIGLDNDQIEALKASLF